MTALTLHEIWPVFGIQVCTPTLELRPVDTGLAVDLANLAAGGIHPPDEMPFLVPWTDAVPPTLQRNTVRHFWEGWSQFTVESWRLPFAVFRRGDSSVLVGSQAVHRATAYPALRSFETGSWVAREHQGQGIGREMREAVLHLMFAGLDAREATTGAFADNAASLAVTRSLGYEDNGTETVVRRGVATTLLHFRMPRERWEERRRADITIDGLDTRCLEFLGLGETPQPVVKVQE